MIDNFRLCNKTFIKIARITKQIMLYQRLNTKHNNKTWRGSNHNMSRINLSKASLSNSIKDHSWEHQTRKEEIRNNLLRLRHSVGLETLAVERKERLIE